MLSKKNTELNSQLQEPPKITIMPPLEGNLIQASNISVAVNENKDDIRIVAPPNSEQTTQSEIWHELNKILSGDVPEISTEPPLVQQSQMQAAGSSKIPATIAIISANIKTNVAESLMHDETDSVTGLPITEANPVPVLPITERDNPSTTNPNIYSKNPSPNHLNEDPKSSLIPEASASLIERLQPRVPQPDDIPFSTYSFTHMAQSPTNDEEEYKRKIEKAKFLTSLFSMQKPQQLNVGDPNKQKYGLRKDDSWLDYLIPELKMNLEKGVKNPLKPNTDDNDYYAPRPQEIQNEGVEGKSYLPVF